MSEQNKLIWGFLLLFSISLLFAACEGVDTNVSVSTETIAEQPTSIPIEAPVPTPTIEPTPTINPEQQELLTEAKERFDQEGLGFNDYYELEFVLENGQVIAQSPYAIPGDPYFTFDADAKKWVDNHPGRSQIETFFPEVLDNERSIWIDLEGFIWDEEAKQYKTDEKNEPAVWDKDMMAYRYPKTADIDEGHEQYYLPLMALTDRAEKDIKEGRVTFAETIESDNFVLGESGVKLDYFISADHPYVKWWENLPSDVSSRIYSKMFLDSFPWLKGQQVTVRIVSQDITAPNKKNRDFHREQTIAQGDYTTMANMSVVGFTPEVAPDTNLITISITISMYKNDHKPDDQGFAIYPSIATFMSLSIQQYGNIKSEERASSCFIIPREARSQVMAEFGISEGESLHVESKEY